MVILIAGATHTGKTVLAQKLLEKYHYPYLSIDHLKMGLIRSGNTQLTPADDDTLTAYLWPIVQEIIKTAIENQQNLIVEGCYIPFAWKDGFEESYLFHIRALWLIMSKKYIETNFDLITSHANDIESRLEDSGYTTLSLIQENLSNLENCEKYGCDYILIDDKYEIGEISWLT